MTALELWNAAGSASRDVADLLYTPTSPDKTRQVIEQALSKSRAATSALEALQRLSVGMEPPKRGD